MKRAVWITVIIILAVLAIAKLVFDLNNQPSPIIVTSIPYTSTPSLRSTPTLTPQPATSDLGDCFWWYQLTKNLVGDTVCVLGHVKAIVVPDPNSDAVRIYLKANLPKGYRLERGAPKEFYFYESASSSTDLKADDCVTASGILSVNNDGILFMRLDGNLEKCAYR
jgi:hypothetical protein